MQLCEGCMHVGMRSAMIVCIVLSVLHGLLIKHCMLAKYSSPIVSKMFVTHL